MSGAKCHRSTIEGGLCPGRLKGRRTQELTAINVGGSLTQQVYDALGNLVRETDPNNASSANPVHTDNTYDPLNRLLKTVDRLAGETLYSYDANDRVKQITAPNALTTSYIYDDLVGYYESTYDGMRRTPT